MQFEIIQIDWLIKNVIFKMNIDKNAVQSKVYHPFKT